MNNYLFPLGLYFIAFRVPDVYGVFQFKVEYQLGYTIFSLSKQVVNPSLPLSLSYVTRVGFGQEIGKAEK